MWQYNYTNELAHYGILGMKWGVRRYQNKDGSLTPAGKRRREKQNFREDVKAFKSKKGLKYDTEYDEKIGTHVITQWYDSRGAKVGRDYVEKVMRQAMKEKTYVSLAGTAAVLIGASVVGALLGKSGR